MTETETETDIAMTATEMIDINRISSTSRMADMAVCRMLMPGTTTREELTAKVVLHVVQDASTATT